MRIYVAVAIVCKRKGLDKHVTKIVLKYMCVLRDYVAEKDFDCLLSTLHAIKNDTLRKTVSVLVLQGGGLSGKSTLGDIMRRISPSSAVVRNFWMTQNKSHSEVILANNSLVLTSEVDNNECDAFIQNTHHFIISNTGQSVRPYLYQGITVILNPGVFVVLSCKETNSYFSTLATRKPMRLCLPNKFKPGRLDRTDLYVKQAVWEFNNLF